MECMNNTKIDFDKVKETVIKKHNITTEKDLMFMEHLTLMYTALDTTVDNDMKNSCLYNLIHKTYEKNI